MSRDGIAMMGGSLAAGILVGYVFVVPGLGTVAIAGLLGVPLSTMLIYGFLIGPPTAVLTTLISGQLLRYGLWNKAKDETDIEHVHQGSPSEADEAREGSPAGTEPQAAENSPP